ncbi:hypothetical protein GCM10028798_03070 [Humibacter antri]
MSRAAGFVKKHVTDLATEVRAEQGLGPFDALDPFALAASLEIPVFALSTLRGRSAGGAEYLLDDEPDALSAVTVFHGTRRHIVFNDSNSPARQRSDVSHELSHGLLLHEPTPALDDSGLRDWDQVMEDEAQYMAGALLLTEQAVLAALRRGENMERTARLYQVSVEMVRWRINVTGARKRVQRSRGMHRTPAPTP